MLKIILGFFALVSISIFSQFTYPASHQRMVVSSYNNSTQPVAGFDNNKLFAASKVEQQQNNITFADASLVAQQAAIYALTFSPINYKELEQMAVKYFSHSGWQQYMTPELIKSRMSWLKSHYRTVVFVNALPTVTTAYVNQQAVVVARLSVLVDLYSSSKFLTRQPLELELTLQPVDNIVHWQVVAWKSALVQDKK